STTDGFNNLADCIDHQLRLLFVYFVATIRVGNVLFVRHELGESFLPFLLRGIGDIAKNPPGCRLIACLPRSWAGPEDPTVGLQIIQRWELKPEAEQRELVLSCDPRRSFREPGTKQRFRAHRLRSAFAVSSILRVSLHPAALR